MKGRGKPLDDHYTYYDIMSVFPTPNFQAEKKKSILLDYVYVYPVMTDKTCSIRKLEWLQDWRKRLLSPESK